MANTVSLELVSVGSNSAGGYDAYPYYLSVNGSSSTTPLMCLSYNNEISFGETWDATVGVATGNTLDEEAAWLLNDANTNTGNADSDQLAAWSLFANNVPMTTSATDQLILAQDYVASDPIDPSFYNQFTIYTPIPGSQSSGGTAQTFIGDGGNPVPLTVTPEPSSLMLLGSGLFGVVAEGYRRRRSAAMSVR